MVQYIYCDTVSGMAKFEGFAAMLLPARPGYEQLVYHNFGVLELKCKFGNYY